MARIRLTGDTKIETYLKCNVSEYFSKDTNQRRAGQKKGALEHEVRELFRQAGWSVGRGEKAALT
jgi:hypothetical protein